MNEKPPSLVTDAMLLAALKAAGFYVTQCSIKDMRAALEAAMAAQVPVKKCPWCEVGEMTEQSHDKQIESESGIHTVSFLRSHCSTCEGDVVTLEQYRVNYEKTKHLQPFKFINETQEHLPGVEGSATLAKIT